MKIKMILSALALTMTATAFADHSDLGAAYQCISRETGHEEHFQGHRSIGECLRFHDACYETCGYFGYEPPMYRNIQWEICVQRGNGFEYCNRLFGRRIWFQDYVSPVYRRGHWDSYRGYHERDRWERIWERRRERERRWEHGRGRDDRRDHDHRPGRGDRDDRHDRDDHGGRDRDDRRGDDNRRDDRRDSGRGRRGR